MPRTSDASRRATVASSARAPLLTSTTSAASWVQCQRRGHRPSARCARYGTQRSHSKCAGRDHHRHCAAAPAPAASTAVRCAMPTRAQPHGLSTTSHGLSAPSSSSEAGLTGSSVLDMRCRSFFEKNISQNSYRRACPGSTRVNAGVVVAFPCIMMPRAAWSVVLSLGLFLLAFVVVYRDSQPLHVFPPVSVGVRGRVSSMV